MQKITQTDVRKFKALYMRYFEVELSDDDARLKLSLLITLVRRTYRPIKKEPTNGSRRS